MVKKVLLTVAVTLLIGVAAAAEEPLRRTLTVTGTAEVNVQPDICYMGFGVETRSRSAAQAYKDNNDQMNKVNAAVRELGIEAKDLQTTQFSIMPEYHYEKGTTKRVFDGYRVSNMLHVKVRDLKKVSTVLDAAMAAGATEIGSVTFTVENPKKYTADARIDALKAAQTKAEVIATQTGMKLKKPISISESEPGSYNHMFAQANTAITRSGEDAGNEAALEPGEVRVTHTAYITYEIE